MARTVLEAHRRRLGKEHPDTQAAVPLDAVYRAQNKFAEAEPILTDLLEAQRRVKGEEDSDTLNNMQLLAVVYHRQGKLEPAETLMRRALEIRHRVQGEEHPATLVNLNDLGSSTSLSASLPMPSRCTSGWWTSKRA